MIKFKSIDNYIGAQPAEIAKRLSAIRVIFHNVLPETKESIRYEVPSFTVGGNHLYIGGYKNHIGMYPIYGISELSEKMEPYKGKGTKDALHFKHDQPIPYELIKDIITAKSTSR